MKYRATGLALALTLTAFGGHATAKPELKDVTEISEGIIAVGIAYEISEVCASIEPRTLRGIFYLNSLRSRARNLGYSHAEIEAYINNDAEKVRLEAVARGRLADMGAIPGNAESHCVVGRAEIARQSAIGRLLR